MEYTYIGSITTFFLAVFAGNLLKKKEYSLIRKIIEALCCAFLGNSFLLMALPEGNETHSLIRMIFLIDAPIALATIFLIKRNYKINPYNEIINPKHTPWLIAKKNTSIKQEKNEMKQQESKDIQTKDKNDSFFTFSQISFQNTLLSIILIILIIIAFNSIFITKIAKPEAHYANYYKINSFLGSVKWCHKTKNSFICKDL